MAENSGNDSAATTKRKYDDSAPPPRRVSGFSAAPPPESYNNVPPPMDEIQLAKQKAQEIAARLINNAEAKRPKFDNGGGYDDNDGCDSSYDYAPPAPAIPSSYGYGNYAPPAPSIPSSYGYGNPSKKIEIPSGRVGVIIGKAGETIKSLQMQSGAKIQVTRDMDADPHSLTRDVELTGSAESIATAEKLIRDVLAEAESGGSGAVGRRMGGQPGGGTEQFVMQIPTKKVGLVIGKGGETIKNMQASTGARIQVIPLHPPPGDTSTERTVQIDGTSDQIEAAKQMVNEVISENRQRNTMGGGYSQQGYQAQQPPTSWAPPGQQMQQSGYGYPQPGAYPTQYTQQSYNSYPQQTSGGYATSWDQSSAQQTTQGGGGYDYYGQPQTQAPGGSGTTDPSSAYAYNQQTQGYSQDGYAGYASAPQSGYDQQQGYGNPASGYNVPSQTADGQTGQTAAHGGQVDNANQAPPTSAPQSGYAQQPSSNPGFPPQSGYGVPPTSQPGYGTQPSGYAAYGPPSTQKPGAASAQTGYAQPAYGAPHAYSTAGYSQPPAYGGSYGGGYQPPAYSSDAAAPASHAAQPIPKASPK